MTTTFAALETLLAGDGELPIPSGDVPIFGTAQASVNTKVFNGEKLPPVKSFITTFTIIEKKNDSPVSDYEVFMFGPIFEQNAEELYQLLEFASEETCITFYIGSPGGSLKLGANLAAAMRCTKAHTVTVAVGMASSVGSLLWFSGKEKTMFPCSTIMYHMSSHGQTDNSVLIKERADYLIQYVNKTVIIPAVEEGVLTAEEAEDIVVRKKNVFIPYAEMMSRLTKEPSDE